MLLQLMGDHIPAAVILVGITSPVRNVGLSQIRIYVNVGHLAILSQTSAIVMLSLAPEVEVEKGRPEIRVLRVLQVLQVLRE